MKMAYGIFTNSDEKPSQETTMKKILLLSLAALCFCCFGCSYYSSINGKVLDNTTGKPIEGAVVVAQWTKSRGIPGMQYHDLHKITETLTDKEGKFSLSGTFALFIDPPEMIICKEGYIPWRNDMTFPGGRKNKDNEWNHNMTYKLDVFTDKYTYGQLYSFLDHGMMGIYRSEVPITSNLMLKLLTKTTAEIRKQKSMDNKP